MNFIFLSLFILILSKLIVELALGKLNRATVLANKETIPTTYVEVLDEKTYKKSIHYTLAKNSFNAYQLAYDAAFLSLFLFSGLLPNLFNALSDHLGTSLFAQANTLVAILLVLSIPSFPFDWWYQFKIEEAFGFNRSTQKLWLTDKLKGLCLTILLGIPLSWVLLKFFHAFPSTWWIWGFIAFFSFQLLMLLLYPRLILPLFNKLKPLEDGPLKTRLLKLANKANFKASEIQVMDGSKRSSHSNAFFTGFGRFRKIIFFDTLIEQLEPQELEAVLAHEIGHYKLGHIPQRLVISAIITLCTLGILNWIVKQDLFYTTFGFDPSSGIVPAIVVLSLITGLVAFWVSPLFNAWSRLHEFQADQFAKKLIQSPLPLISSLRKMTEKNLSNLTPHPLFSKFYYSHPTLIEREQALLKD